MRSCVCVVCGKVVTGKRAEHPNTKTCSPECSKVYQRGKARAYSHKHYVHVQRYCVTCGAKIECKSYAGRAAKQCPACRAKADTAVNKGWGTAPLTPKEKHQAVKLMVWLDDLKERMAGAKPCIDYNELIGAWQEIKTIPLKVSG